MTEPTMVALAVAFLGAIPPTVMAYAALVQSRKNAEKTEQVAVKADSIEKKTDQIHTLANSNLATQTETAAKQTEALAVANERIAGMEKLLATLTEQRNSANMAVALATPSPSLQPPPPAPPLTAETVADALKAALPIPVVVIHQDEPKP